MWISIPATIDITTRRLHAASANLCASPLPCVADLIVRYFTNFESTDTIEVEKSSGGRIERDRAHFARQPRARFDWNPFRNSRPRTTPFEVITTDPLKRWRTFVPDLAHPCLFTGATHGFVAPACAIYRKEYFTQ